MTSFRVDPGADPIARAVAKLGPVCLLESEDASRLICQPAHVAQVHHIGPRFIEVEGAAGEQHFQGRLPPGYALRLTASQPRRYTVEFLATGAKIEFTMLAGQSFTVRDNDSDLKVTMDDVEAPEGGLQLVTAAQPTSPAISGDTDPRAP